MKVTKATKGLLLGLALLLATSAFAANKGSLSVSEAVNVNGKQLKAGDYKVTWEGAGPNVKVNIMKGNKVVATAPAQVVELSNAPSDNAAVVSNDGGRRSLSEIRFSGKKYALAFGGETAKAEPADSTK
jgi:hypothetical protein